METARDLYNEDGNVEIQLEIIDDYWDDGEPRITLDPRKASRDGYILNPQGARLLAHTLLKLVAIVEEHRA